MKIRRIDMYLMNQYKNYCDEALRYNDIQKTFQAWKEDNIVSLVKDYKEYRRLDRYGSQV
jgi:hypothetical protein